MSLESPSGRPGPAAGTALADPAGQPADPRQQARAIATLVLIVILGYAAFLTTGFGSNLDRIQTYLVRPLPLYVYFGALLLFLQWQVVRLAARPRTTGFSQFVSLVETLYIFLTSAFALVYMGQALFFQGSHNITQQPLTYIILNASAFAVLVVDFVYRRTKDGQTERRATGGDGLAGPFLDLAVDVGGIAAFSYLAWAILTVLDAVNYVVVDIHQLHFPGVTTLQDLDLVLALAFTALALVLAVMQGLFVGMSTARRVDPNSAEHFWMQLLGVARTAAWDGLGSLRLVLGPLIWLIPAYSIGQFAIQSTDYFRSVANVPNQSIWELFNPFTAISLQNYGRGLLVIVLAVIAVAAVVVASAVVEHNFALLQRTLETLRDAARAVTLILALFLLSLAVINAVAVIVAKVDEPFQLGAVTLFALILAVATPLVERMTSGGLRRR